jgi:hypothetical protein
MFCTQSSKRSLCKCGSLDASSFCCVTYSILEGERWKIKFKPVHRKVFIYRSLIITLQITVFSLLSLKRKVRLMRSPVCVCLSVCLSLSVSSLITFEPVGRFLWNSVGRSHAIEGDLDAVHFNPVPSTIPKWWTFKLLRWIQNLQPVNVGLWNFVYW